LEDQLIGWCCIDRLNRQRLSGIWIDFRVARNPSRAAVKRVDHFLEADLSLLIGPTWIASGLPTIHEPTTTRSQCNQCWR